MENQDINEESINNQEDTKIQNEATSEDNDSTTDCRGTFGRRKDRYIRLYAEFENYKKRTSKEKMEFSSMPIRI
jgi:molecular chaperone GrpE